MLFRHNDALSAKRQRIDVPPERICRIATQGRNIEATSPPLSPLTCVASPTADTAATMVAEHIDCILNSMNAKRTYSLAFDITMHDLDAQLDALAKARHGMSPRRRWRFVTTAVDSKKEKDAAVALLTVAQQQP